VGDPTVTIIPDPSKRVLRQIPAETPSREAERNLAKMSVNFAGEVSLSYSAGIFNMP
jgi:hypothetical protein